jgi:hypothetical protein
MKKSIIGAIVGGLLFFICQSLSWTVLDLHRPTQDYTANQDTIMKVLNSSLSKDGGYLLPSLPAGTSSEEMMKKGEANMGKPWATIQYHKSFSMSMNRMYMNMAKGLLFTMLMLWFVCWITGHYAKPTFLNVFLTSIFIGLIVFINIPYNAYIWYDIFDVKAYLHDALLGWGVCGIWLGWWMSRKAKA